MRFVVLLYQGEEIWENATAEEQQGFLDQHEAFERAVPGRGGAILGGEGLQPVRTATTVRRRGSSVGLTDGPFAETVEQLGGFYLLEVPDIRAATDLVTLLPEYTIELRPVAEF